MDEYKETTLYQDVAAARLAEVHAWLTEGERAYIHIDPLQCEPFGPEWLQFYREGANGSYYIDNDALAGWRVATAIRLEYKFNVEGTE